MGSYYSCHSDANGGCSRQGKVVLTNGAVYTFDHQVTVAELMLEHPRHYVVEYRPPAPSSSSAGGRKLHPLPADHKLDVGRVYVMVPKAAPISAEEARRRVSSSSRGASDAKGPGRTLPLFANAMCLVSKINSSGTNSESSSSSSSSSSSTMSKGKVGVVEWSTVEGGFGERPEILSRQYSIKGWKPSLGTIEEKTLERRKMSHWLFVE